MTSSSDTLNDPVLIDDEFIIGTNDDDSLAGGEGNDTIIGRDGDDTIDGGGGDDELSGNRDDDTIRGGNGDDTILASGGDDIAGGGEGADRLDGGTGNDTVDYSDALADIEIDLENERATIAGIAKPEFIFNFENALGGAGNDTLIGTDDDNFLDGGPGDDSLLGGGGDDTLAGDPGNDTLDGGPGDDTADYSGTDIGAVFDLATSMVILPDGTIDHLISIEHVIATQGADTAFGTEIGETLDGQGGDDVLIGDGGDDTVLGGDGDDSLVAGSMDGNEGPDGDDLYDGGEGNDTISFEDITEDIIVDLENESAGGDQIGDDTVTDIENVFGGWGNDFILGDALDNVLCGNDGDDFIDGAGGDDTLIGGGGDDTIEGGAGNDVIYGDSAAGIGDVGLTIRFVGESAGYRNSYGWYNTDTGEAQIIVANVDVDTNPALAFFVTELSLTSEAFLNLGFFLIPDGYGYNRAELDGGDPSDLRLEVFDDGGVWKIRDVDSGYAFSGANDATYFTDPALNPGGLDHTMIDGGLGTFGQEFQAWEDLPNLGDHDFDDTMFHLTLSCGLGLAGSDFLIGGEGDDTVFGNEHGDILEGGEGDDSLDGNGGDDLLDGGEGDDIVKGGAGDDTLIGDPGSDTLDGGPGIDTADYSETDIGGAFDLPAGMVMFPDGVVDHLISIENVIATQGDDTVIGTEIGETLDGQGGNDVLIGNGGDDTVLAGDGDDSIVAGSMDGNEGADGADLYDGGNGNDTISFEDVTEDVFVDLEDESTSGAQTGDDTVTDIENVFGGRGNDFIIGDSQDNVLCGNDGHDYIDGSDGDDTLIGGGGDDTIEGGAGNDVIYGDSAAGIGDVGLTIRFVGESAGYRNSYGWYNTDTGEAQIIVANVDVDTNPALPYMVTGLPLAADEYDNLGFFLIPNGYSLNLDEFSSGNPNDFNLEVFEDDGIWKIRNIDTGYVFSGVEAPAFFSEPAKNFDGLDHTMIDGDLAVGGQATQGWEDQGYLGDQNFTDAVFHLTLSCGLGLPGSDLLMGGAGDDTILGNEFADTLQGGSGADSLMGNAGDDSLDGGDGMDTLRGSTGRDIVEGGAGADELHGGSGDDTLDGGEGEDFLWGGRGNDILEGGGGSDSVYGNAGDDLILGSGSADDDGYYGGDGNDTINYEDETDEVLVDLGAGFGTGDGIGDDVVDGIENAVGGSGDDTLIGSAVDNELVGNDGDDLLEGSAGNDTLDGTGGNDTVSYETTTAGVVVDLGAGMATGPEVDTDTLVAIENAFGGSGEDSLTGSDGANQLVGNAGEDTIEGGAGDDTLEGGDGDDLILSGNGDDLLTGGDGADTFLFDLWSGTDTISDFTPGACACAEPPIAASDNIDVSQFGFANLFELGLLTEGAIDGTWIRLSQAGGGDVFLEDVVVFDLTSNDFIL